LFTASRSGLRRSRFTRLPNDARAMTLTRPKLEASLRNIVDDANLKWVWVSGKGGCGKTSNSCALAVQLAAKRHSILLVSLDPAHNLSDAFNQKFSREPTKVNGFDNLDAMEVEPPTAADAALSTGGNDEIPPEFAELYSAIPGIDEAMAFGTLMRSVSELQYDVVVFDCAPTGHTLRLMSFPSLVEKAASLMRGMVTQFGPMIGSMGPAVGMPAINVEEISAKIDELDHMAKQITTIFSDRERCTFVCVCIAEFLSVFETERLVQELSKYKINVRNIVVNQVIRKTDADDPTLATALYKARLAMQHKYLEQLLELYGEDFHLTPMPMLTGEVRGREALNTFAELLLKEKPRYFRCMPSVGEIGEYPGNLKNIVDPNSGVRWILTTGKGGQGKTTLSCSLAVALEKTGKKVLVVSTDPAHNLSDAFAQKISGSTSPTKIDGFNSIYALEVDATDATENFLGANDTAGDAGSLPGGGILPIETIRQLVTSIPGIDEAVSFSQISKLVQKMDFDVVLVDMAPTGHALRLLAFPAVAQKALAKFEGLRASLGPMLQMITGNDPSMAGKVREAEEKLAEARRRIEAFAAMLTDQEHTTFVCISIAEFLSVYETERLVQALVEMDINVRNVVVNQLMDPEEKDVPAAVRVRSAMQEKYIDQLAELYPAEDYHVVRLPLLPAEVRGVDKLREFGAIACDPDRTI
jgi:arsenite/tail-anchored protein-transporting ATPase